MSSEIRPYVIVAACIVSKGYVLLTKRDENLQRGEWELPGGKVRLGEFLRDALVREIREELDWTIEPTRLVHTQINNYADTGEDYLVLYYECKTLGNKSFPALPPAVDSCWVGVTAALRNLFCLPGTAEAVSKVLSESKLP